MQQLSLKERPARRSLSENFVWIAIATLATMALGAYATTTDAMILHIIYLVFASATMLIWVCSVIEIILDQRYNRSLPECIEDHLNQNLDQDDYEQLRLAAQEYPAIRPWISDCIKNGALTYRDAEPLFMRINLVHCITRNCRYAAP